MKTGASHVFAHLIKLGKRGIPIAIRTEYYKKAKGVITCKSENVKIPETAIEYEHQVILTNSSNEVVAAVWIKFSLSSINSKKTS